MTGEKAAKAFRPAWAIPPCGNTQHVPSFANVEIGGGHITGTEISEEHPEGISFGMYHADQYTPPEGTYATVQAVDGTSWYRHVRKPTYCRLWDAVEKFPYMARTAHRL